MPRTEESKRKNREYMKSYNTRYFALNREKILERNRKYQLAHPEKSKAQMKRWKKENPEKVRSARLKYKYGIDLNQYNLMLEEQGGVCAICNRLNYRNLSVDHDHKTGMVRGLLCDQCNVSLGLLGEDIRVIERILIYLNKWKKI